MSDNKCFCKFNCALKNKNLINNDGHFNEQEAKTFLINMVKENRSWVGFINKIPYS